MVPFALDYEQRTFQIRNGSAQSFTVSKKTMVWTGEYKPDDTGGGSVFYNSSATLQGSRIFTYYIFNAIARFQFGTSLQPIMSGCVTVPAGTIIRIAAPDDMDITVYTATVPESP